MRGFDEKVKKALQKGFDEWVYDEEQFDSIFEIVDCIEISRNARRVNLRIATPFAKIFDKKQVAFLGLFIFWQIGYVDIEVRIELTCEATTSAALIQRLRDKLIEHLAEVSIYDNEEVENAE